MKKHEPTAFSGSLDNFFQQGSTKTMLLQINGDAGEEFEIFDGDWVMLDRERIPQKFDLVVITDGENFSVEYYQPSMRNGLRLVSELTEKPVAKRDVYGVVTFIVKLTVEIKI